MLVHELDINNIYIYILNDQVWIERSGGWFLNKLMIILIILNCFKVIFVKVTLNKTFENWFVKLYEIEFLIF